MPNNSKKSSLILNGLRIIKANMIQIKKAMEGKNKKVLIPNNKPILKITPKARLVLYNLNTLINVQIIRVLVTSAADK